MRILYVISGLTLGGAEKQLVGLSKQLVRRGHEVAIYTLNDDVPRKAELHDSGVGLTIDQKRLKLDPGVLLRLRGRIRSWQPDIVHGFLFDGDFYARLAAAGTGIPVLNSERNDDYRLSWQQAIAHRLTRAFADGVVANTFSGKSFAERLFGLAGERVHVVWNGIDLEELERDAAASDLDYRLVFFGGAAVRVACLVGAIKPQKNYHLALDSAVRLIAMDPAWRVLFVGDQLASVGRYKAGPTSDTAAYKAAVLRYYERLDMSDRIRFCGRRNDVAAILKQSDVLFVTSLHEGFPNVVLEAMALGVPVVSTEYSDIRRILPFPEQVVSRHSPDDVARAVIWAHAHCAVIAARQTAWVRREATLEKAAGELENVYRKYLRGGSRARSEPLYLRGGGR